MDIETLKQLADWNPPDVKSIIDKGILLPQTRLILYGPYKSWKSLSVMDIAFCIAEGRPWHTYDTSPCRVLLIQIEIPRREFRKRVLKYANGNNSWPEQLLFCTQPYLKLDHSFGMTAMENALRQYHPEVLIIDPIYKVISGDISNSYDVMKFLDNMDILMNKYGCAIILVSHTRKPIMTVDGPMDRGTDELMGSSYLANWCDTAIGVKVLSDAAIQYEFATMRHAEEELKPLRVKVNRTKLRFSVM